MSEKSTIQIKIGAVEVTCQGGIDPDHLEDVLRGLKAQLPDLMQVAATAHTTTAAELLASSQARTFGEKAGVIAWWLEEVRGRRDWRSGDVLDILREIGETMPANITDALNQKLKKGLFEVHDRRWKLTGEGRGWVKYRLLDHRDEDE